ncbi:hypothetical protein D3C72_2300810 [compost metagenome]
MIAGDLQRLAGCQCAKSTKNLRMTFTWRNDPDINVGNGLSFGHNLFPSPQNKDCSCVRQPLEQPGSYLLSQWATLTRLK